MAIAKGIQQNSPQWIRARLGMVTASHMGEVMAKLKRETREAASRRKYRRQLALERLNNCAIEHFVTKEMQWGIDHQEEAASAYEVEKGVLLAPGGLWLHDRIGMFAASPDYLLPDGKGLVEVKCPTTNKHFDLVDGEEIDELDSDSGEWLWQMRAQLACTGRAYCDFVSWDPRMKQEDMRLFIRRISREDEEEDAIIRGMELEVEQFLVEVDRLYRFHRNGRNGSLGIHLQATERPQPVSSRT